MRKKVWKMPRKNVNKTATIIRMVIWLLASLAMLCASFMFLGWYKSLLNRDLSARDMKSLDHLIVKFPITYILCVFVTSIFMNVALDRFVKIISGNMLRTICFSMPFYLIVVLLFVAKSIAIMPLILSYGSGIIFSVCIIDLLRYRENKIVGV
jgi:hypothetical protein